MQELDASAEMSSAAQKHNLKPSPMLTEGKQHHRRQSWGTEGSVQMENTSKHRLIPSGRHPSHQGEGLVVTSPHSIRSKATLFEVRGNT